MDLTRSEAWRIRLLAQADDMMGEQALPHYLEEMRRTMYPRWRPLLAGLVMLVCWWALQYAPTTEVRREKLETGLEHLIAKLQRKAAYSARTPATRRMLADQAGLMIADLEMDEVKKTQWVHKAVAAAMIPSKEEMGAMQTQLNNGTNIWWVTNLVRRGWSSPLEWILGRTLPTK